jgi:hypothetical protein
MDWTIVGQCCICTAAMRTWDRRRVVLWNVRFRRDPPGAARRVTDARAVTDALAAPDRLQPRGARLRLRQRRRGRHRIGEAVDQRLRRLAAVLRLCARFAPAGTLVLSRLGILCTAVLCCSGSMMQLGWIAESANLIDRPTLLISESRVAATAHEAKWPS